MNTREAMERLAKCGVVVHGHRVNASTLSIWYDDSTQSFVMLDRNNDHAEVDNWVVDAILEAAWHRKYELATVRTESDGFFVYDGGMNGYSWKDTTRLGAIVAHAEDRHEFAKESP